MQAFKMEGLTVGLFEGSVAPFRQTGRPRQRPAIRLRTVNVPIGQTFNGMTSGILPLFAKCASGSKAHVGSVWSTHAGAGGRQPLCSSQHACDSSEPSASTPGQSWPLAALEMSQPISKPSLNCHSKQHSCRPKWAQWGTGGPLVGGTLPTNSTDANLPLTLTRCPSSDCAGAQQDIRYF